MTKKKDESKLSPSLIQTHPAVANGWMTNQPTETQYPAGSYS